jgi:malonyl-CoA/methylmalonyl-CoA synthetase
MLTHGNLAEQRPGAASRYWGWRSPADGGDVLIHALPIFHVHGLFVASHGALINGSKMIWFNRFDPQGRHLTAAAEHACSWACPRSTPACWPSRVDRDACANMRLFISGSAPLLPETLTPGANAAATPSLNGTA